MDAESIPAASTKILYEGRTAPQPDGSVRMAFPGTTVHLAFTGPRLLVRTDAASPTVYMDVAIDGGDFTRLHVPQGPAEIVLFNGGAGAHTAQVVRRNETWMGMMDIDSFEAPGGEFTQPAPLPGRKLMFIGDSITAGQGSDIWESEGVDPKGPGRGSSGRHTYGYLTARMLEAQVHIVGYGGRGITRDWQGINISSSRMPVLYERALPDDPHSHWDHSQYVPDAIVVCLGQNDFNVGIPDQVEWVNAYAEFVRKLVRDAPNAKVFLVNSPMNNNEGIPRRDALIGYLNEVVRMVDLPQVRTITISNQPGYPGDGHPTREEHQAMANEIAPVIQEALGW